MMPGDTYRIGENPGRWRMAAWGREGTPMKGLWAPKNFEALRAGERKRKEERE